MPNSLEHLGYMELGKDLNSDIIYLEILGNKIVVLNSASAASDLLEKRSAIYSDRACPPIIKDPTLFDWSQTIGMVGYNDTWRHYRRMMNAWLNNRAVIQFHNLQEHQTRLLLQRLLDASGKSHPFERVKSEFFFTTASIMFQLAYGYQLRGDHDQYYMEAKKAIEHIMSSVMFTNFYVNLFPALARVPDWFPGTGWKRTIRAWREQKEKAINAPFEWTQAQVNAGLSEPSMLGALLQDHKLTSGLGLKEKENLLKDLSMSVFIGGADTSATALLSFVAAMILHPHVQEKAQQEIDAVLGPNTLPTMSDRERLPYVNNLILELLRWHPVIPNAIPHVCSQDDVYRGYDILKGTIVIGNVWAMTRDENVYKSPEVFDPDRFLDPSVPPAPVFGWGRRICPGVHLGEAALFITISSLLATYTFSKKRDEHGREIDPVIEIASNAAVLELKPFEFEFQLRSEKHRQLIREAA